MKKCVYLLAMMITLLVTGAGAVDYSNESLIGIQTSHEILLEGFSWRAFEIDCQEGNRLSGSFEVECDGSLYIGDAKKYDDWSLEGIQFYVLDEGNYSLFSKSEEYEAAYVRNDVQSLSWTFKITSDGTWYIVYDNNSIYLMGIEGSINCIGDSNALLVIILCITGGLGALGVTLFIRRK